MLEETPNMLKTCRRAFTQDVLKRSRFSLPAKPISTEFAVHEDTGKPKARFRVSENSEAQHTL